MPEKSEKRRKPRNNNVGGARPGSGRPALATETADMSVRLSAELMQLLDAYRYAHELPSRSAAVRELLEKGLVRARVADAFGYCSCSWRRD